MCRRIGKGLRRGRAQAPPSCPGMVCEDNFRNLALHAEVNLVEIRDHNPLGKGVFAKANIPINQLLGEYVGELLPTNTRVDPTDPYVFALEDLCIIGKSSGDLQAQRLGKTG